MSTILASTSQAAAATTTTSSFLFNPETIVTAIITNGGTPPSQQGQVALQLSVDNSTWYQVDIRTAGAVASATYYNTFDLSNYFGNNTSAFAGGAYVPNNAWVYYRLYFFSNNDQAITVAANDGDGMDLYVLALTGVSGTGSAGQGVWTPTWGGPTIINNVVLYVTNNSGGASNLFVGVANNATSNTANIINGAQLNAAAGTIVVSGANNSNQQNLLNAGGSIVFTANANAVGFKGQAYIYYTKLT